MTSVWWSAVGSGLVSSDWGGLDWWGERNVVVGIALRWSERGCAVTSLERKRRERYHGRGPERALEDVKGRGVVIVVAGVRGMSESAGLTFMCITFRVCVSCSALQCRCARLTTTFFGDAVKYLQTSTWVVRYRPEVPTAPESIPRCNFQIVIKLPVFG